LKDIKPKKDATGGGTKYSNVVLKRGDITGPRDAVKSGAPIRLNDFIPQREVKDEHRTVFGVVRIKAENNKPKKETRS